MTEQDQFIIIFLLVAMWCPIIGVLIYKLTHSKNKPEDFDDE
jgi:hypothetical protein